jgi:hypothetical protein
VKTRPDVENNQPISLLSPKAIWAGDFSLSAFSRRPKTDDNPDGGRLNLANFLLRGRAQATTV